MKNYKILLMSFVLIFFLVGAVSASEIDSDDSAIASTDDSTVGIDLPGIIIGPDLPFDPVIPGDDDEPVDVEVDTKDIYVKDTGDDSNSGSAESPYATVGRALSDVNASNDATIHIGEGTFLLNGSVIHYSEDYGDGEIEEWDEASNGLNIDLNHNKFGGNLKFIGAGADKTFLDGQSSFYFAKINSNANVLIKDVTFINCKNDVGGTILNYGNLTVENCVFKDSYAVGKQGGAISSADPMGGMFIIGVTNEVYLTVKNSQFISSSVNTYQRPGLIIMPGQLPQGGGAIYAYKITELYLENNTFINTKLAPTGGMGVAVYSSETKTYLINNKFINLTGTEDASIYLNPVQDSKKSTVTDNVFINCTNPSSGSSIVTLLRGSYKFENNTFVNSSNSVGNVYSEGYIEKLNFEVDNSVINISNSEINNGIEIPYNVTDDMGNIVKTTDLGFKFVNENNIYTYYPNINDNIATISFSNVPENGIYNLTIFYNNGQSTTDTLTLVNISTSNEPVDLYVSTMGSDANDGTLEDPFATIQRAINVGFEKSFTVIVHLIKGTYFGVGNVGLNIANKGNLQIIGEAYNETVIDGNNSNWFMSVGLTNVIAQNLTFINGNANKNLLSGSNLYLKDCIVDNNTVKGTSYYIMSDVAFDNLVFTNNKGSIYYSYSEDGLVISNGYFANNDNSAMKYGVLYIGAYNPIVENCTFINNTAKQYGAAIYLNYGLTSRNNRYEGNVAPNKAVIYMGDNNNWKFIFENDTFINNKATSGNYGVTGVNPSSSDRNVAFLNFTDCKFINNSAVEGGAIGLKQGSIVNCTFTDNSADYGGAIAVIPVETGHGNSLYEINFDNTVFENNNASTGKDIYFDQTYSQSENYKNNFVRLTLDFNDLNVSSLADNLTVNVTGPCGAIVGGGNIVLTLNGTKIGSTEIVNGVATFEYVGFEEGIFAFSGSSVNVNENSKINNGTIIVKLEGILDSVTYWVSANGSDENGNGSQSNPFKSISHAIADASKNCRNITIHIGEGNFTGELNTALTLSSMNNITLVGVGVDKTVIDGENITYFATITDGKNKISISDLSIKNMLPDNRQSQVIDSSSPIVINEGANLVLNNVELSENHGGNAIILNDGNLIIENSVITKNGLSKGLIIGGNVSVYDSEIFDNYFMGGTNYDGVINCDLIDVNNTIFKGNYIIVSPSRLSTFDFVLIKANNITIENTNISSGGDNESLKALGFDDDSICFNPALTITGSLNMSNSNMVNDFEGTIYSHDTTSPSTNAVVCPSALNAYSFPGEIFNIVNSTFKNFKYIWITNAYFNFKYKFDGCLFNNITFLAASRTIGPESQYNISNSVFLFEEDVIINQQRFEDTEVPNVNFDNNYWGNNSKPTVYFLGNMGIKDETYSPDTWIILTSEDDKAINKTLTDGENSTNYTGIAPIREGFADDNGMLGYAVVFSDIGYLFTTDDDDNVIFNPEEAIYPFEDVDPMNYRDNAVMDINKINGSGAVFGSIFDVMGNPVANATVVYTLDDVEANTTTDENGSFVVFGGNGDLNITFIGDDSYFPIEKIITLENIAPVKTDTKFDLAVDGNLVISGILSDVTGKALANTPFTYIVNGSEVNATTDANGAFTIEGVNNGTVEITFIGDDSYLATSTSLKLDNIAPTRIATVIESDYTFTRQANDYSAGERGDFFYATLKDINGNPISNVTCYVAVNGPIYNVTTDENGKFGVQVNLAAANTYTYALSFLGNEKYEASLNCSKLVLTAKKTTITAKAKAFKAKAKTKTISVTLSTVKNPYDGKTYLKAGKKLTMKLNGKTYTAKINAKGVAKFTIKLTKKGKYSAKITFAGDKTYKASSKTIKVTIK